MSDAGCDVMAGALACLPFTCDEDGSAPPIAPQSSMLAELEGNGLAMVVSVGGRKRWLRTALGEAAFAEWLRAFQYA